jgi:hypothetical protein
MNRGLLGFLLSVLALSSHSQNLITTNSTWEYFKGASEASSPASAWRNLEFNEVSWLTGQAPFYYENDPGSGTAYTGNTDLTDMYGGYTCIFMRQTFVVTNVSRIGELQLQALSDDGFIAWINGVEVARFNMPLGDIPYDGTSSPALGEPVPVQTYSLDTPSGYLVNGTNVLAIQAFNSSLGSSSDFVIWANLSASGGGQWSGVGISEFMAANLSTVTDEDGDHSPWIEIRNPTSADVNLNGWALTDDPNNLTKWLFPNVTLLTLDNANGSDDYIVVFADGKDRTSNTNELHTNFSLSPGGGYLALVNAGGTVVSSFYYPAQQINVSYGRDVIHPGIVGSFANPTPGEINSLSGTNFAPAVTFSRAGGTFSTSFALQLLAPGGTTVIHYTLDGTVPTQDSAVYTAPLSITSSVQVRARAFDSGGALMPGPVSSETYLQLNSGLAPIGSSLPAIVIYNFGAGSVPQDLDQFANVALYEPQGGVTRLTNAPTLRTRAFIHVRGSSTAYLPKQSFAVKFSDEYGVDANYSPLGLPAESSWVLYAPNLFEPVMLHNPLIYQLSNDVGQYAPRTRFVEVYLNTSGGQLTSANYNGIYVLEEKIKWDNNRVNVKKLRSVDNLNPHDNALPNVTGGYMMRVDRLDAGETGFNSAGQNIVYDYPKEPEIKTPQRDPQKQWLQNYMDAFGTALNGPNYADPTNGYRAYIEDATWIDHHIINAVAFNVDALRLSAYFRKDRGGKLVFGPIWDFDRSQGSTDGRDFSPFYWRAPNGDLGTDFFNYTWWGRMFTDTNFWQAYIDRYQDLRANMLSTNHIYAVIDGFVAQIQSQQPREVARWPDMTTPRSGTVSISGYTYNFPGTYAGEVSFLKKWYADRLRFMDTNFLAKPVFSDTNGAITPGFTLSITAPAGATIYYSTNGVDPRASGGGISPSALVYSSAIALSTNVTVMARARDVNHHNLTGANNPPLSSPWSGLAREDFVWVAPPVVTQAPADLDAYIGQNPLFTVQATGSPAPSYQWSFNGTAIPGATSSQLALSSLQTNQAGIYSILATNRAGSTNVSFTMNVTTKPNLVVTEAESSEALRGPGVTITTSDWWELSNLGTFAVNLRGYHFNDDHATFANSQVFSVPATIAPGESIVLVQDMTVADFRTWWGLPVNVQVIPYAAIGFGSGGDAIYLWNAAASSETDSVCSVTFGAATRGVTFGFNPSTRTFGSLSVVGQNGAYVAPINGDIGSPGKFLSAPQISSVGGGANGFQLGLVTQSNLTYRVEYKNSLTAAAWTTLTNFTATSTSWLVTDPSAGTNSSRFYRVAVTPY